MDKFCYLCDMLSVDGDADVAVENRIQIGWNKFRHLVPLLTNNDISLVVRGRFYSSLKTMRHLDNAAKYGVGIVMKMLAFPAKDLIQFG